MTVKDIDLVSTEELAEMDAQTSYTSPIFGSYASDVEMPETKLNKMPIEPRIASEMIREYIGTEGNAHQNLCTFVQTYMEPEAQQLMADTLEKNAIDKDEYPMTADLENRCVKIIQDLWHADQDEQPMGTSTVGSSEACMLGGLAALFRWKALAKRPASTSTATIAPTWSSPQAIRSAGRSSAATGTSRCVWSPWTPSTCT